jgi:hypothetical protein
VNGASSDPDLERALTDAQLASGKSLVVMCSSEVHEQLEVFGGGISSTKQAMCWLVPHAAIRNDCGGVRRATRVLFQTAGGEKAP